MWSITDDLNYYSNLTKNIKNLADKLNTSYYEDLAEKFILNNSHAALVTTYPEAGLAEEKEYKHQQYLEDLKASLSAEEIEKIIDDTKAFNEWNTRDLTQERQSVMKDLQVVTVADLPVEIKERDINETKGPNGERIITATADVGETGITTSIMFDTSSVPAEKLHFLTLLSDLLGRLNTEKYTREQLNILAMRHLEGAYFSIDAIPYKGSDSFTPVLSTSWLGLMGEYSDQIELAKEIILNKELEKDKWIFEYRNRIVPVLCEMAGDVPGRVFIEKH